MDKLIIQTKIENLLDAGRTLRWADRRGVWISGKSSIVVDGAYPTACRNPGAAEEMQADIERGRSRITILTNIPVEKIKKPVKSSVAPRNVRKTSQAQPRTKPLSATHGDDEAKKRAATAKRAARADSRWATEEEGTIQVPKTITLPGQEDLMPPEPETVELFGGEGASLERQEDGAEIEKGIVTVNEAEHTVTTAPVPEKAPDAIAVEDAPAMPASKDGFAQLREQEAAEPAPTVAVEAPAAKEATEPVKKKTRARRGSKKKPEAATEAAAETPKE